MRLRWVSCVGIGSGTNFRLILVLRRRLDTKRSNLYGARSSTTYPYDDRAAAMSSHALTHIIALRVCCGDLLLVLNSMLVRTKPTIMVLLLSLLTGPSSHHQDRILGICTARVLFLLQTRYITGSPSCVATTTCTATTTNALPPLLLLPTPTLSSPNSNANCCHLVPARMGVWPCGRCGET